MIYITRTQKSILAVAVIILVILSGTMYIRQEKATEIELGKAIELKGAAEALPAEAQTDTQAEAQAAKEPKEISVYICGNVNNPGVVTVKEGARLDEALALVGGAKEDADLNAVNLAYRLEDEDMIYIPLKGEKLEGKGDTIPGVSTVKSVAIKASGKININTAGEKELDTLEGIGPATAKSIIQYRNANGPFKSIEDIKKVKGIGDSKFNSIKDKITVD
jgi:competence protein ComEA